MGTFSKKYETRSSFKLQLFELRSVYKHLFIKYKFWKDHSIYRYFETQIAGLWCSTTQFYGNILYMSQFGLLPKKHDSHSYVKPVILKIVGPFRYYFVHYANLWNWCVIFPIWIIFKVSFLMFSQNLQQQFETMNTVNLRVRLRVGFTCCLEFITCN